MVKMTSVTMASDFIVKNEELDSYGLYVYEKVILPFYLEKLQELLKEEFKDTKIEYITLHKSKYDNQPWGKHPSGLSKMTTLLRQPRLTSVTSLTLSFCELDTVPDVSPMRRQLRKLDLRGNRISVLPDLRPLSGIEELSLQGNPIPVIPGLWIRLDWIRLD